MINSQSGLKQSTIKNLIISIIIFLHLNITHAAPAGYAAASIIPGLGQTIQGNWLEGIGWFTHEIFKHMVLNHPEVEFLFIFDRDYDKRFIFAKNVSTQCDPSFFSGTLIISILQTFN